MAKKTKQATGDGLQATGENQESTVEYVVAIGMIHEDGKAYYNGQSLTLSPERAKVRIADGSVIAVVNNTNTQE